VVVEIGREKYDAIATIAEGTERDRIYGEQSKEYPQFGEYQKNTARQIPVVLLSKKG
jgi:hypothetical protein